MFSRNVPRPPRPEPTKEVAVVVPLSNREELTPEEEISYRHLMRHLGRYDKYLLAPRGLQVHYPDFVIKRFDDKYFGSVKAHTALMLSPLVYESFSHYKYILTYHLDALVFSDQLLDWCDKGFDFIGAPRLGTQNHLSVVGNGGFALRRVESFLKVFRAKVYAVDPVEYWENFCARNPGYVRYLNLHKKYLKRLRYFNNVSRAIQVSMAAEGEPPYEDIFISEFARHYNPDFKIAPLEAALRFAFDEIPRQCFALNNYQLPFGCHAWHKHDREFWEPYLLV